MFGLTLDKVVIIGVIAAFLLGPSRLPAAAETLGRWVRGLRQVAEGAKTRLRDETGTDFGEIDWKRLDPRQYDPRRIIRDALLDPASAAPTDKETGGGSGSVGDGSPTVGDQPDASEGVQAESRHPHRRAAVAAAAEVSGVEDGPQR